MIQPTLVAMNGPGSPYGGMPGGTPPPGGFGGTPPPGGFGGTPPPGGGGYGPPGGPPGGPGGFAPQGGGPQGPRNDALAIVSLVAGLLSVVVALVNVFVMVFGACCALCAVGSTFIGFLSLVPGIIGAVCGGLSIKRINERPDEFTGKGLAIAGAVVSGIGVLLALITIILPWLGLGCLAAGSAAGGGGSPGTWTPPSQPSTTPTTPTTPPTPVTPTPNPPMNPTPPAGGTP